MAAHASSHASGGPGRLFQYELPYAWGSLHITPAAAEEYNLIPLTLPTETATSDWPLPFQTDVVVVGSGVARSQGADHSPYTALYGTRSTLRYRPGEARIVVGFQEPLPKLLHLLLSEFSAQLGRPVSEVAADTDDETGIPLGESMYEQLPEQLSQALSRAVSQRIREACGLHAEQAATRSFRRQVRNVGIAAAAGASVFLGRSAQAREASPAAYGMTGLLASGLSAYAYRTAKRRQAEALPSTPPNDWLVAAQSIGLDIEHTFSRHDFATHFNALLRSEPSL